MPKVHLSRIDKLGERGFAGPDVAASPSRDDDAFWPEGPSSVGVSQLVELIAKEARGNSRARKKETHWAFLLGGAGNGKSFAARSLLNKLSPRSQTARDTGIPKRKYVVKAGDCSVCIINDATIAAKADYNTNARVALAEDVLLWLQNSRKGRSLAFACVNRGIVLEELNHLLRTKSKALLFSAALLRWLGGADEKVFRETELPWVGKVSGSPPDSWYRRVRIAIDKSASIVVHALSVDVGSIFDPRPSTKLDVTVEPPVVPDLNVAADFRPSSMARLESVAGNLVSALLSTSLKGAAAKRPESCPLRANIQTLEQTECRASWLTALRGAEIAAGRQTTYRDFWGVVALSLTGPRTIVTDRGTSVGSVSGEVDTALASLAEETRPAERLRILGKLARRRLHMAIFRGESVPLGEYSVSESPPDFPAARGLVQIDPASDISQHSSTVEMAIEQVWLGGIPSEYLVQVLPSLKQAWQPFDSAVEREVLAVVNSDETSDRERRGLLSWFSGYLLRACGCYVGGVGHEAVISAWYRCWHSAGAANPQFPVELNTGLRTLLLPAVSFQANMEQQLAVPAFASRANPFESSEAADGTLVLSLGVNHLRLRPKRRQDRLWIELVSRDSTVEAHSPLDFALLREAVVCRMGAYGFTESGFQTAPRLERARASMISTGSKAEKHFGLVSGTRFKELAP